jgi:hypothetical protein
MMIAPAIMRLIGICELGVPVPRRASSVSEIDQIVRVHGLLANIGLWPSPLVEVVTASGKSVFGQLIRDVAGNAQTRKGWNCYGAIMLSTEQGKVEIDYLDVVTVEKSVPRTRDIRVPMRKARRVK